MERSGETSTSQKRREGGAPSKAKNCAECRRLKIKCDRQVPCSNCVKRGTASICPDGQLLPKGQRLILSSTEDLHSKIEELTERIRQLEDALALLQAQHSDEPHPLLGTAEDVPITSFGSLMIKEDGNSRFFGATSSVEWIMTMQNEGIEDSPSPEHLDQTSIDNDPVLEAMNDHLQLTSSTDGTTKAVMMERAIAELPRRERAVALVDCYYLRAAWELSPVPRARFIKDCFGPCYERPPNASITLQDFALLYAVLALGTLHNAEDPNSSTLASKYMSLCRSCLTFGDFITNTSLSVIDTIILCAGYHYTGEDPAAAHKGWVTLGVALKLAVGMGLHREPSMWGLSEEECARRRRTMWELVSLDLWAALISGRPPMLSRQHFDVRVPLDNGGGVEADPNFSRGKHYFSEMCLWQVLDLGLASSNKVTYAAVLKVDTRIRNWTLPKSMQAPNFHPPEEETTITNFRNTTELIFREITLLCLHRSYFACALLEPPYDPLGSSFSRSVLAIYGSSCAILGRIRVLYAHEPILIMRFGFFWTHAFSAAVILGSIAIRAPDCTLAPTALIEFDGAVDMFKRAQAGFRAGRCLPTLLILQAKAHAAFNSYRAGTWVKPTSTDSQLQRGLGGSAIVQHVRARPSGSPPAQSPSSTYQQPEQPSEADVMASLETVEPSLEEYLRSFGFDSANTQNYYGGGGSSNGNGSENSGTETGMYFPSSDAFLHGVLTGQWGGSQPSSSPRQQFHPQQDQSSLGYSPASTPPASMIQNPRGLLNPQIHVYSRPEVGYHSAQNSYRPSPPPVSEGGTSSTGSVAGVGLGAPLQHPPSPLYQTPISTQATDADESQASFMWDNFLKELGVQGDSA